MRSAPARALALLSFGALWGCHPQLPEDFAIAIHFQQACEGDDGDTTTGGELCAPVFYADGTTIARLVIDVPIDTSQGKPLTVRTNLGVLDPTGNDAASMASIELTTLGEQPLFTDLFVGSEAGRGIVTVEAGGLSDTAEFFVEPLLNELSISGPAELVADGRTLHAFTISLDTQTTAAQTLTLTSTLGKLEPALDAGAPAFTREVSITRANPLTIQLQAPATAGTGQLRARFGDGPETEISYVATLPEERIELALADPAAQDYFADDETLVPLEVSLSSDLDALRTITLKASKGVLDGATDARELEIQLRGGESTQVLLLAGREFGPVVVTAKVSDDGMADTSFELRYSPPTLMSLVAQESLLRVENTQSDLTAFFGRPVGEGRVSLGTRVELASCCDPDDDGVPTACDEYVELPAFADAPADGTDAIEVEASLTPTGMTYVQTAATPGTGDLLVTIHAYVLGPGDGGGASCGSLDEPTLPGITAKDSTVLALRPSAP